MDMCQQERAGEDGFILIITVNKLLKEKQHILAQEEIIANVLDIHKTVYKKVGCYQPLQCFTVDIVIGQFYRR